jgi:hypothetical protein
MRHEVIYNTQRNNYGFAGLFPGWAQCFSTSSWMLMSFFSSDYIGDDDDTLAQYVDDVEMSVGSAGIAEEVVKMVKWITGRTSLWWAVQKEGIEKWLWRKGVKGEAYFIDGGSWDALKTALSVSPVILGTSKIGGLPDGHIILLIGHDGDNFIAHDPYGDATTNYLHANGDSVIYSEKLLKQYAGDKPRFMYYSRSVI